MTRISLTQGRVAIIDDVDFVNVRRFRWHALRGVGGCFYAHNNMYIGSVGGKKVKASMLMHRLILRPPKEMDIDHIDGNGLNNQRKNLRICTRTENSQNARKIIIKGSRFKGVSWHGPDARWRARIRVGGKTTFLGNYKCEEDAARAYDEMAVKAFGQYARVNLL